MIAEAFIFSLLIGFIRKGRLRSLGEAPLRHTYLFVLAFALLAAVEILGGTRVGRPIMAYVRAANVMQYLFLLGAVAMNRHIREMLLAGVGIFMNALVIAVNGGAMPVSASALRIAGLEEMLRPEAVSNFVRHSIISSGTHLKWIADIIPLPGLFIMQPQVFSVGDVLVAVAVFAFIQRYMLTPAESEQ